MEGDAIVWREVRQSVRGAGAPMWRVAGVFVLGVGAALFVGAAPAGAQRAAAHARSSCDTCDTMHWDELQQALQRAQAELAEASAVLAERRAAVDSAADSTGAEQEAFARAEGELRRARERYSALLSRAVRHELADRAAQDAEVRAMRRQLVHQLTRVRVNVSGLDSAAIGESLRGLEGELDGLTRARASMVPTGWLGVSLSGSDPEETMSADGSRRRVRFRDYPTVETVDANSPAERGGVRARDRILAINGADLRKGTAPLDELLKPGAHLSIRVKRGREVKNLAVIVGKRPPSHGAWAAFGEMRFTPSAPAPRVRGEREGAGAAEGNGVAPIPPMPPTAVAVVPMVPQNFQVITGGGGWGGPIILESGLPAGGIVAGAQVQRVGEMKDYFGVTDGLLVLSVLPGTPADSSGLRGGDVILRADGHAITTPRSLSHVIEAASEPHVSLDVMRKKQKRTLVLRWDR